MQTTQSAVRQLRKPAEIRIRCQELLSMGECGKLHHFQVHTDQLDAVAHKVAEITRARYPDLNIPIHSRWRHFEVSNIDRWKKLTGEIGSQERARIALDLVIPSVLLDAGAGPNWVYRDTQSGLTYTRSEGLAVATFAMFISGGFSSENERPLTTDGTALMNFSVGQLTKYLQVNYDNPLDGLEGRVRLLQSLGKILHDNISVFGAPPRVGNLYDYVVAQCSSPTVASIFDLLLDLLSPIWPDRLTLNGENLGDVWYHTAIRRQDETDQLIPFHKLTQWLTYSLIEPLAEAGVHIRDLDSLTGLAEYRNGGLLVDMGVIQPRDLNALNQCFAQDSELVVEWRALTLALLDKLAPLVRQELDCDESQLPLGAILEGGTWAAGRLVAAELRKNGEPPIKVYSNGTLF